MSINICRPLIAAAGLVGALGVATAAYASHGGNELESLRAEKAARVLADEIESEIKASGVDTAKITPAISKTLNALESVDRKALLADLAVMSKTQTPAGQKPVTATKIVDATESAINPEELAARITGIKAKK